MAAGEVFESVYELEDQQTTDDNDLTPGSYLHLKSSAICFGEVWRKNTFRMSIGELLTVTANMRWQQRHMILTNSNELQMFKTNKPMRPIKTLSLADYHSVHKDATLHIQRVGEVSSLKLEARGDAVGANDEYFGVVSTDECTMWLNSLNGAFKRLQEQQEQQTGEGELNISPPVPRPTAGDKPNKPRIPPKPPLSPIDKPEKTLPVPLPRLISNDRPKLPEPRPQPPTLTGVSSIPGHDSADSSDELYQNTKADDDGPSDDDGYVEPECFAKPPPVETPKPEDQSTSECIDELVYEAASPLSAQRSSDGLVYAGESGLALLTEAASWNGTAGDALKLIESNKTHEGLYLVRQSQTGEGKRALLVISDGKPCKLLIDEDPQTKSVTMMHTHFADLETLLQHYTQNNLPGHTTRLETPYSKLIEDSINGNVAKDEN